MSSRLILALSLLAVAPSLTSAVPIPKDRPLVAPPGEVRRTKWDGIHVHASAFSPDGRRYALGGDSGSVRVWDVETGEQVAEMKVPNIWMQDVAFSPDGKHLFTAGTDHIARRWDAATGKELTSYAGHKASLTGLAVAPDGQRLLTTSANGSITWWDLKSGLAAWRNAWNFNVVPNGVRYTGDGKQVLAWMSDGSINLIDAPAGKILHTLKVHNRDAWGAWLSPDGKAVLSYGIDRTVKLTDVATGKVIKQLSPGGDLSDVKGMTVLPDHKRVITGHDNDHVVKVWDLDTAKELVRYKAENSPRGLAVSPDGRLLTCGSFRGRVYLWRLPKGER